MTNKDKLIGLAQCAQVAAQSAGFTVDLRLFHDMLRLSVCDGNFGCLAEICLTYSIDEVLGCAILKELSRNLRLRTAKQEGGEQ